MYGRGISREGELLDLAVKLEIIQKSGAWFSYKGERLGQGRDNVKIFLADEANKDIADEVEAQVRENAYKIYNKTATASTPVAKPVAAAVAPAPAKSAGRGKPANIDIEVDD